MDTEKRNEFTTWPSRFVEAAVDEIVSSIKTVPNTATQCPNAAKEAKDLWRKLYGRKEKYGDTAQPEVRR